MPSLANLSPDPLNSKSARSLYAAARPIRCIRLGCFALGAVIDAPIGNDRAVWLDTDHCASHADNLVYGWAADGSRWVRLTPESDWMPLDDGEEL